MNRTSALLTRLCLYTGAAFLLSVIPSRIVELGSLCIIYHITGYKCIMCGMTRAFSNMMHFAFARAVSFNPLVLFVFPLCLFLFLDDLRALLSLMRGNGYRSVLERIWYRLDRK